ncbi:hypothetical protein J6590_090499 [Homalodisca vitripennis]|nr:hypothetical protein J6590_087531 [Homalodisca vitripennis]KAG8329258.1 hypothetical protein J6590_090499 [Homalodisca vitripennis]
MTRNPTNSHIVDSGKGRNDLIAIPDKFGIKHTRVQCHHCCLIVKIFIVLLLFCRRRFSRVHSNQQTEPAALELEMDSVNDHECMATLCAVIKHLCDKFPQEGQLYRVIILPFLNPPTLPPPPVLHLIWECHWQRAISRELNAFNTPARLQQTMDFTSHSWGNSSRMIRLSTFLHFYSNLTAHLLYPWKPPRLPPWMKFLKESLIDRHQPANCRVFILRLIMNCQSYFRPHASIWVAPILEAVIDNCFNNGLNFLIHDVVCMLYDWHPVYVLTNEHKLLASDFLRRLVQHTPNERAFISKYNTEVVKCVVSMWKTFLVVPYQELIDHIVAKSGTSHTAESGILLADIFLSHQILPFNETGKARYYENLLANLKNETMSIYKNTAALIGKVLRTVCEEGSYALTGTDDQFFSQVQEYITLKGAHTAGPRGARNIEQFIYILYEIQANYPAIVKSFVIQCIAQLKMPAKFRQMMVECLTTALDFDFRHEAFSLVHLQLPTFITDNREPRQVHSEPGVKASIDSARLLAANASWRMLGLALDCGYRGCSL